MKTKVSNKKQFNIEQALDLINERKNWDSQVSQIPIYRDFDTLLQDGIKWAQLESEKILPRLKVREFIQAINDLEVRLNVVNFLLTFGRDYLYESIQKLAADRTSKSGEIIITSKEYDRISKQYSIEILQDFQDELNFQKDLISQRGLFSPDKFKHQEVEIRNLKKEVKELQDIIAKKDAELDRFKNPIKYGKQIPPELDRSDFIKILNYLKEAGIIHSILADDENGRRVIACYFWDASKVLFGYFVEKVSNALNLRGARVPLDWQLFEPVFLNFNELVTEAMKALSTYNNSSSPQKNRIKKAEIIDKAIEIKDFDPRYA